MVRCFKEWGSQTLLKKVMVTKKGTAEKSAARDQQTAATKSGREGRATAF